MSRIHTHLWFADKAEEAAEFYVGLVPNSSITSVVKAPPGVPDVPEGAVFIVPSIVDTVPKSALELINNAMATYKEYSGDLEYVDVYPKNPPNAK